MRIVKIITGVVGALVLIIGGLIIYLANLDLNAHKEAFAPRPRRRLAEIFAWTAISILSCCCRRRWKFAMSGSATRLGAVSRKWPRSA